MSQEEPREAGPGAAETVPTETVQEPVLFRPAPIPLGRGTSVGRYVILDAIGSGGMGVVYAGYDPELDRKVALKLLRPDRAGSEAARLRLLREAQAIARLSHPNVVTVHDAGTFGNQVFVAMEFVEGRTLRQWLAEAPRSWREILDRFVPAGRGLAAAHAAGLVHHDFKPGNVLLGEDGRVRVADFLPAEPGVGSGGTPAYMAPEQIRWQAADARSDQFAFCVALYGALYGERPFAGSSIGELAAAFESGDIREAPAGSRVPSWLRQIVLRGLSLSPEERYPSMDELLRDLGRDPAAVRRRWMGAAAALVLAGTAVGAYQWQAGRQDQLCRGGERKLAGVWDAAGKERIRASFLATKLPFAPYVWKSVERSLDGYTRSWGETHREACEATRLRGEQSEDLLDRRMLCLDQRLVEVRALTALFSRADRQVVEKALDATKALPPVEVCSDAAALTARVPPPRDPLQRARVAAVQATLAEAKALADSGKEAEALARLRPAAARARAAGYRPVEAEVLHRIGFLERRIGQSPAAESTLFESLVAAQAGGGSDAVGRAAGELAWVVGVQQERHEEGHRWMRLAQAAVEGMPGGEIARAELRMNLGALLKAEGKYDEALAVYRQARDASDRAFGPDNRLSAAALDEIGLTLNLQGRTEEALGALERALEIRRRILDPRDPDLAKSCNGLGNAYSRMRRYGQALAMYRQALDVYTANYGPRHLMVAGVQNNLGILFKEQGRFAEAMERYRRSLAILEEVDPDSSRVAMALANIGELLARENRFADGLPVYRRALAIDEKVLGSSHPDLAYDLEGLAHTLIGLGRRQEGIAALERALAIREEHGVGATLVNTVRFTLAQALWDQGTDRGRALRLARQARDGYAAAGERADEWRLQVEAWLREHGSGA